MATLPRSLRGALSFLQRTATRAVSLRIPGASAVVATGVVTANASFFRFETSIDVATAEMLPKHRAAVAKTQEASVEARKMLGHVLQVALQNGRCAVVHRRIDDLRHVDERGTGVGDEDVESGEVAVNAA